MKHLNMTITGKVQGVFFREEAKKKAEELGIRGFVRNEELGSVYIEAEGWSRELDAFALWCEEGPAWARVSKVERQEIPPQGFQQFAIR